MKEDTLHQKINEACEMGKFPIVSNNKEYVIVTPFKDEDDYWRCSNFHHNFAYVKTTIGAMDGKWRPKWINYQKLGFDIIGYYEPPYTQLDNQA
jgi:hypothetical protein